MTEQNPGLLDAEANDQSIKRLVDHFYGKVIDDDLLGPIFRRAIGEKLEDWSTHLATMYRFWSSVMQCSGRYKGNPMKAHKDLSGVEPHFFDRWLALWDEATGECCEEELANIYRQKARNIANSLKMAMFYQPGQPFAPIRAVPA
ncbi:group III truncated hemoglobin [Aestuariispira insulae]|nr:group III truncated hemoglobin [Aestuariispira insulae]